MFRFIFVLGAIFTPILTFPHQGGRDNFIWSINMYPIDLSDKHGIVFGIANHRSIAWGDSADSA